MPDVPAFNAGRWRLDLRTAIAAYLQERYRVQYDPQTEFVISVGVSEALYLALTALLQRAHLLDIDHDN